MNNEQSIQGVIKKQIKNKKAVKYSQIGEVNYITQPRTNVDVADNGEIVVAPNSQYKRRFS